MGVKLNSEERARILAGDHSALKREKDPGETEGTKIPLLRRAARRVPVYAPPRFSGQNRELVGYQELPEYWSVWIELGKATRHRQGHWRIPFDVQDRRPTARVLRAGGPPGPRQEPGLRTRERSSPRRKGEGVGTFTDEAARGYGGSGRQALDYGGLDDDELEEETVKAHERRAEFLTETAAEELDARQLRAIREQLRRAVRELPLELGQALLAKIEREIKEALVEGDADDK